MSTTELILEILKYTLPAGLVLAAAVMVIRENQKKTELQERYGIVQKTYAQVMPLRLQAYERAILFLERISPENLLLRVDARGKTARQFQLELIQEIRGEYDHNVAQQLYVTEDGWSTLARAKEQIIGMINRTARELQPEAQGSELGRKILNKMVEADSAPARDAIKVLKRDIQKMFNY